MFWLHPCQAHKRLAIIGSRELTTSIDHIICSTACLVGITGVFAPVLEETVFRGFFMMSMTKWYGYFLFPVIKFSFNLAWYKKEYYVVWKCGVYYMPSTIGYFFARCFQTHTWCLTTNSQVKEFRKFSCLYMPVIFYNLWFAGINWVGEVTHKKKVSWWRPILCCLL